MFTPYPHVYSHLWADILLCDLNTFYFIYVKRDWAEHRCCVKDLSLMYSHSGLIYSQVLSFRANMTISTLIDGLTCSHVLSSG